MRSFAVILVSVGLFAASAFAAEEKIAFTAPGNALDGRRAFVEMKCTSCHRVLGDPSLPKPVTGPAPVLGGLNSQHTTEELAQALVMPSHTIAPGFQAEADGSSPMRDMSRFMTVRELIDIVAYLKQSEDSDAPWPKEGY